MIEDIYDASAAVLSGIKQGMLSILDDICHPLDNIIYPITDLIHDTTIISVAHCDVSTIPGNINMSETAILATLINNNPELYDDAVARMELRLENIKLNGESFAKASGLQKIEAASSMLTTIFVPGYFLKAVKATVNFHHLGTPFAPKFSAISNWLDEMLPEIKYLTPSEVASFGLRNELIQNSGRLIYVITEDYKLLISTTKLPYEYLQKIIYYTEKVESYLTEFVGHRDVSRLKPVFMAGEIEVDFQGFIRKVDTNSRCFQSQNINAEKIIRKVFVKNGYPELKYPNISQVENFFHHSITSYNILSEKTLLKYSIIGLTTLASKTIDIRNFSSHGNEIYSQYDWSLNKNILIEPNCFVEESGWTPLHVAYHYGDVKLVKHLLKRGAYVVRDREDNWPYQVIQKYSDLPENYDIAAELIWEARKEQTRFGKHVREFQLKIDFGIDSTDQVQPGFIKRHVRQPEVDAMFATIYSDQGKYFKNFTKSKEIFTAMRSLNGELVRPELTLQVTHILPSQLDAPLEINSSFIVIGGSELQLPQISNHSHESTHRDRASRDNSTLNDNNDEIRHAGISIVSLSDNVPLAPNSTIFPICRGNDGNYSNNNCSNNSSSDNNSSSNNDSYNTNGNVTTSSGSAITTSSGASVTYGNNNYDSGGNDRGGNDSGGSDCSIM